jgi:Laminin N-terminal (Domain VI).
MNLLYLAALLVLGFISPQEVLQPPYFDIAKGKRITATSTCGENFNPPTGTPGELFCALADVPKKFGESIKGFSCSHCVPGDFGDGKEAENRDHNILNANDGSNRWWQSPPLSRGLQFRQVNVTIDLGQVCFNYIETKLHALNVD